MTSLRCRLGFHDLYVLYQGRETPLWASRYLLALTGTVGCHLFCRRCDFEERGYELKEATRE